MGLVKHIQFNRNSNLFASLEELLLKVNDPSFIDSLMPKPKDGEFILLRYLKADGEENTLIGKVYYRSSLPILHLEIPEEHIREWLSETKAETLEEAASDAENKYNALKEELLQEMIAKDAVVLTDSKVYTDQEIVKANKKASDENAALKTEVNQYTDEKINEVKTYSDTKNTELKAEVNEYTDEKTEEVRTTLESALSENSIVTAEALVELKNRIDGVEEDIADSSQVDLTPINGRIGDIENEINTIKSSTPKLENGKISEVNLPSYVDDVLEFASLSSFPSPGESGKIYVDTTTNKSYRWSGTTYIELSKSIALGETAQTAYRGDFGKEAYDHSNIVVGNPHKVKFSEVLDKPTTYTPSSHTHPISDVVDLTLRLQTLDDSTNNLRQSVIAINTTISDLKATIAAIEERLNQIEIVTSEAIVNLNNKI